MKKEIWEKSIKKFLIAQTISLFGSALVQYSIIWYVTLHTSSGKMLTISTVCAFLPQILVSLFAGVWIDRYNRKKIIMLSDSIIAISTLFLASSFIVGYESIWLLFIVLIIRSIGTGIQTPSVQTIIAQIVPKEHLMKINGINSTLSSFIMFLSPAISGMLFPIASLGMILLIDVVTAIVGIGITFTVWIGTHQKSSKNENSMLLELKEGLVFLKENRFVKRLIVFQLVILFCISPSAFLTPLMVSRTFGAQVWRLTASEMTYSLGMILGGFIIARWGSFRNRLNTTILAGALYGIFMFGMGMMPFFLFYLVFNVLIGVTSPCYTTPIIVTIQENINKNMQGRVFSFMQIANSCALPSGMLFFGPLADTFKVQTILMFTGILVVAISFFVYRTSYFAVNTTTANKN